MENVLGELLTTTDEMLSSSGFWNKTGVSITKQTALPILRRQFVAGACCYNRQNIISTDKGSRSNSLPTPWRPIATQPILKIFLAVLRSRRFLMML